MASNQPCCTVLLAPTVFILNYIEWVYTFYCTSLGILFSILVYFLRVALFVHGDKRDNILRAKARYHSKN